MLLGLVSVLSLLISLTICFFSGAFAGLSWLWILPVGFLGAFLILVALGFAFLMVLCRRVDQSVPQDGEDKLYRTVAELIVESALPFLRISVKTSGLEKVPKDGRFLVVANHTNDSDPIILLYALPGRQLAFVSKKENSTMFVIGPMMHKLQCQLINRENDREALKTILKCIQILKEDKASIGVFPEGGIDADGLLHRFKPGVFKIAQKRGADAGGAPVLNAHGDHCIKTKQAKRLNIHIAQIRVSAGMGVNAAKARKTVKIPS